MQNSGKNGQKRGKITKKGQRSAATGKHGYTLTKKRGNLKLGISVASISIVVEPSGMFSPKCAKVAKVAKNGPKRPKLGYTPLLDPHQPELPKTKWQKCFAS